MTVKVTDCPFCGFPQSGTKVSGSITGFSDTTLLIIGAFVAGVVFGPVIKKVVKEKLGG